MPPKAQKAVAGRLIGYVRVSTEDQGTDPQTDELRAAGCATIREEHASGADRSRPVLARLLHAIAAGDTLVVVRLDRLARSVSHLLAVIEQLQAKGAYFRSLRDPIDTTTPQGMFSLQVLGAVAQLERALTAERTKAGLLAARKRGRVGGNPGLRARDPAAIRKIQKDHGDDPRQILIQELLRLGVKSAAEAADQTAVVLGCQCCRVFGGSPSMLLILAARASRVNGLAITFIPGASWSCKALPA
jgi:DNA invertase Pin-like site-specific DNA recombinase